MQMPLHIGCSVTTGAAEMLKTLQTSCIVMTSMAGRVRIRRQWQTANWLQSDDGGGG